MCVFLVSLMKKKRNEMNERKMVMDVFVLDKVLNKVNPPLIPIKLKRTLREKEGLLALFLFDQKRLNTRKVQPKNTIPRNLTFPFSLKILFQ